MDMKKYYLTAIEERIKFIESLWLDDEESSWKKGYKAGKLDELNNFINIINSACCRRYE